MLSYHGEAQDTAFSHYCSILGFCVRLAPAPADSPYSGAALPPLGDYWVHSVFYTPGGQLRLRLLRVPLGGELPPVPVGKMPVEDCVEIDPYEAHLIVY